MRKHRSIAWMATPAVLLAGLLITSPAMRAADVPDSEQVSKLLSEAKTLAFQVKEDAATMETFTRMDVSVESHVMAINEMRDHVNALAKHVEKLKAARGSASPWQKTAIDRINPFLDELGGYTSAVVEHLNGDRKRNFSEYRDFLEANADYSSDLAAMIGDFVDYGKAKQRMERMGTKLEVPNTQQ